MLFVQKIIGNSSVKFDYMKFGMVDISPWMGKVRYIVNYLRNLHVIYVCKLRNLRK